MPAQLFTTDFSADGDYYNDGDPHNRTAGNVIDDTFDTVVRPQLIPPIDDFELTHAVDGHTEMNVVLWRGTRGTRVIAMEQNGSAGGDAANANALPPDQAAAQQQVGHGAFIPEFTTRIDLSYSFRHWLVVVLINTRYLRRGSVAEGGWVCMASAPCEVLQKVDRTLGFAEVDSPNAS